MSDTECPYCNADVEICHDDGYGCEENQTHTQECGSCGKTFTFTTSVSFYYETEQAPCQNGEPHDLQDIHGCPKEFFVGKKRCKWCGEEIMVDTEANRTAIKGYYAMLGEKRE